MERYERLKGGLFGLIIGDALGVPYEFHSAVEALQGLMVREMGL